MGKADNAALHLPQMVMIGAFGRNSGKTTLAIRLIGALKDQWPVWGLKVISVDEPGTRCHRGGAGCGMCTGLTAPFELREEYGEDGSKDTAQMLGAGAKRVFLLRSLKEALPDAAAAFARQLPPGVVVVCESNTLRQAVRPGVFLFADGGPGDGAGAKPSAQAVYEWADGVAAPGIKAEKLVRITAGPGGPRAEYAGGSRPAKEETP